MNCYTIVSSGITMHTVMPAVIFWHLARLICCSVLMYLMFRFLIEIEKLCRFKLLIMIYVQFLVKIMQYNAINRVTLLVLKKGIQLLSNQKL